MFDWCAWRGVLGVGLMCACLVEQKTVKDMLKKVVGTQLVEDKSDFVSSEVDRIIASDVATLVAKYMSAEMASRV